MHVRASPRGGGFTNEKRPGHQASVKFRLKKKCIEIPQDEQRLCCTRAIVTAEAYADKHSNWRGFQRGRITQCNTAAELPAKAQKKPGPCRRDEVTRLGLTPSLFGKYRIVVVDANGAYACFTFREGDTTLAILPKNGHYDALTSLPIFFGQGYFSGRCLHPYEHLGQYAPMLRGFIALPAARTSVSTTKKRTKPDAQPMKFATAAVLRIMAIGVWNCAVVRVKMGNRLTLVNLPCVLHDVNVFTAVN